MDVSCSDDPDSKKDPDGPVVDPKEQVLTYEFKTSHTIEAQHQTTGGAAQPISPEKGKFYFSERLSSARPEKLIFESDSVSIVKRGGLSLKYKREWRKKNLYLYNSATETWNFCGSLSADGTVLTLNTGFFRMQGNGTSASLSAVGQEYALTSYNELIDYLGGNDAMANREVVWLKMEYLFEPAAPNVKP